MKKRITGILLLVFVLLSIIIILINYFSFVSSTVYDESTSHLIEVYYQKKKSISNMIKSNWDDLHLFSHYLENVSNEDSIDDYLLTSENDIGFTKFYFIDKEGNYFTTNKETGKINLKDKFNALMNEKKDIVVSTRFFDESQYIIFASPCSKGVYKGFEYEAIAISFNNEDIVSILQVSSFNGRSISYAIHSDGSVIADTNEENITKIEKVDNLFEILNYSSFDEIEIESVISDFINLKSGAKLLKYNGIKYYLVYDDIGITDCMIVGLVPANIVNYSMNKLQYNTMIIVSLLVALFFVSVLIYFALRNKEKLRQKDNMILLRDELFTYLSINVNDIFMMIDSKDYSLDYISPNVDRLLGLSEEELKDNIFKIDELSNLSDDLKIKDKLLSLSVEETVNWYEEYKHKKNGNIYYYQITAKQTKILKEKKYVLVMSDRTEERQKNKEFEKMAYEAQSANRAKSSFLSNISHDIRTPMNAIVGFTTLALSNTDNPEKTKEYLLKLLSSSNHLLSLINDVLDMSKIESGKMKMVESQCNLRDLIINLTGIIDTELTKKELNLSVDINNIKNENVYCDKIKLKQILLNLLSNSVKYTQNGGNISIKAFEDGNIKNVGLYVFEVSDTGIGMSHEFAEKIFDSFEREYSSTVNKIQGTGLGMAIVKKFVDMMDGSITVNSKPNLGTTITVRLPLKHNSDEACNFEIINECKYEENRINTDYCENKKYKILLVEDNDLNVEIAYELLSSIGFDVSVVNDGQKAINKVRESKKGDIDLILMDIQMPIMDGYTATKKIRELNEDYKANIPIIAMTANAFEEDRDKAFEVGMNAFISKPINIKKLIKIINEVKKN